MPAYLRFVRGVIDSEDLPLNVSREILQQNRILETIRSSSVKKLLSEFKKMGEDADKAKKTEESKRTDGEKKAIEKWNKFVKITESHLLLSEKCSQLELLRRMITA